MNNGLIGVWPSSPTVAWRKKKHAFSNLENNEIRYEDDDSGEAYKTHFSNFTILILDWILKRTQLGESEFVWIKEEEEEGEERIREEP